MKFSRPFPFIAGVAYYFRDHTPKRRRFANAALVILIPLAAMIAIYGVSLKPTRATVTTISKDELRTGWYPDQSTLTPSLVSGGSFGQLFSSPVNGQVYAQPLVSQGVLFVATETNNIYGFDSVTGAQLWTHNLGVPFNSSDVNCSDLTPSIGITSTPVIDSATNTAYLTSKTYVSGSSGPATYYMHAVNVTTGAEQSGFPVQIQGAASNDATHTFSGTTQLQRPGLLLMNGVVYAAFGSHCDRKPFEGWVVGVSTAGQITTMWTDEVGIPQSSFPLGGIWQSGGGLVSDGSGQIIFASGNGNVPPSPSLGNSVPNTLGQSVVRLTVQGDGSLKATDFFSPYDSDQLNTNDSDLGSGAPMELPPQYFGTSTYPHLLIQVGKQGYVYLMDANNLGGRGEGLNGSDAVINRIGPNGGVWSKPSVWPGDGGYVYITTAQGGGGSGKLKAYHYGLDGSGKPTLSLVATTSDAFGFSSSSTVITSSGTTSGTALVWVVWSPDGTGVGSQLRAYDPVPISGSLHLRYSAPIGISSKFNSPAVDNGRVYVGTRDGHVLGFGSPVSSALIGSPVDFGTVIVGQSATANATLTANTDLTITALTSSNSVFTVGTPTPTLPATLTAGQTITVPVTFTPITVGLAAGNLTATTSAGNVSFALSGTGESPTAQISVSPPTISFGGIAAGGNPVSVSTTFTNTGATDLTVTGMTLPAAPFSVTGMPAVGTVIASNTSVTVTVTFAPTTVGSFSDTLILGTSAGNAEVPMSGTAGTAQHLQITPMTTNLGNVSIGANGTTSFNVTNTGGSPLAITQSKTPVAGVGFTAFTSLAEGTSLAPGATLTEKVIFAPTTLGTVSDTWVFNSDDSSGQQIVTFTGTGVPRVAGTVPSLYVSDATVLQPTSGTTTMNFIVTLDVPSTVPVTVSYATRDGTAKTADGADYVPIPSTTLTFAPGEMTKTVQVTIKGDTASEGTEYFKLRLSSPTNAVFGDSNGMGWIIRDPAASTISVYVGDTFVIQNASAGAIAWVPVSLSTAPANGQTVTVQFNTKNGSAKSDDYTAIPLTTMTFTAGQQTISVPIFIKADAAVDVTENFFVILGTTSSNATLADTSATVTLISHG